MSAVGIDGAIGAPILASSEPAFWYTISMPIAQRLVVERNADGPPDSIMLGRGSHGDSKAIHHSHSPWRFGMLVV
jgi:hypothetical protein